MSVTDDTIVRVAGRGEGVTVGAGVQIGPFARLRPGADAGDLFISDGKPVFLGLGQRRFSISQSIRRRCFV